MNIAQLFSLTGRNALITGGNSGIGEAMATALGLAGANVTLVARRESELIKAVTKMAQQGIAADYIASDLSLAENVANCAQTALQRHTHIDILINAAGVNMRQPFMEITPESWNLQLSLHLSAPFFFTQALAQP